TTAAAEDRADAGCEFARIERLGQIVVGSDLEADNPVNIIASRGQHKNRNLRRLADVVQYFEAILSWQHHVQKDQVVFGFERPLGTGVTAMNRFNLETQRFEIFGDQLT